MLGGDDLARLLNKEYPFSVRQLFTLMESGHGSAASEAWVGDLASVLADGANNHPKILLPELANLIMTEESGISAHGSDPPIFINQYSIDYERAEILLGNFLDEVLDRLATYDGSSIYANRAKEAAGAWLVERRR